MKYILAFLLLVVTSVAEAATCASCTQILCVADKQTGFVYSNESWHVQEFKADSKYIITTATPDGSPLEGVIAEWYGGAVYRVIILGEKWTWGYCNLINEEESWFECREKWVLDCESCSSVTLSRLFFSLKNMEFLKVDPYGNWSDIDFSAKYPDGNFTDPHKKNTPNMEIGRCSPL